MGLAAGEPLKSDGRARLMAGILVDDRALEIRRCVKRPMEQALVIGPSSLRETVSRVALDCAAGKRSLVRQAPFATVAVAFCDVAYVEAL